MPAPRADPARGVSANHGWAAGLHAGRNSQPATLAVRVAPVKNAGPRGACPPLRGPSQSSGRSPAGAIFTNRGLKRAMGRTSSSWAAITSSMFL